MKQTWAKSYRRGSDWAKRMLDRIYWDYQQAAMDRILRRPGTSIFMAGREDDAISTYGYLIIERGIAARDVVHYLYVKEPFRRLGIATALITASGIDPFHIVFTHLTRDRHDFNPKSPHHGTLRWRGAETLLKKYPEARDEWDPRKRETVFKDGNIWIPYLA